MTDLLLTVIIVGAAVTCLLELIDVATIELLNKSTVNKLFSPILSVGGMYAMQLKWQIEMFVTVPAAMFVALVLLKYLNKPQQVDVRRVPRI